MKSSLVFTTVLFSLLVNLIGNCAPGRIKSDSTMSHQVFGDITLSPDEKWIGYQVRYGDFVDTLFLKSLESGHEIPFADYKRIQFDPNSHWALLNSLGKSGILINLRTRTTHSVPYSTKASFAKANTLILWQRKEEQLVWINLDTQKKTIREGVSQVWESPRKDMLIVEKENGLILITTHGSKSRSPLYPKKSAHFSTPVWSGDGRALVFFKYSDKDTLICHFNIGADILKELKMPTKGMPYQPHLNQRSSRFLQISEDGKWVYIPVKDSAKMESDPVMERWKSETPFLYPKVHTLREGPLIMAWNPELNKTSLVSRNHSDVLIPIRNSHKILIFDNSLYQADYVSHQKSDIRIFDVDKGKEVLRLNNLNLGHDFLRISTNSKYLTYFKNNNWWMVEIENGKLSNLTQEIPTVWARINRNGNDSVPFDRPVWLDGDQAIVLSDKFDLWEVNIEDLSFKRLTKGKENEIINRVDHIARINRFPVPTYHNSSQSLKVGLLLKMRDRNQNLGYAILDHNGLDQFLPLHPVYFQRMKKTGKGNYWISEGFNIPPELWYRSDGSDSPIKLKALFPKYEDRGHGSIELVEYSNSNGSRLKGILYYPVDFDSKLQYPMVVHIYENQSNQLNRFYTPGYGHNYIGWNIANLLEKGYLVFLPDIIFQIGSPGPSALDNVESGVKAVIAKGVVKPESIGLYGHSFGAFEAAYVLTQSKMFATGILGSGVYDIIAQYLNYNEAYGQKPDIWRFETQQFRMGGGLYDDFLNYLENSPIYHLVALDSPILIWAGKQDRSVNWEQSLSLHIALRRLNKVHEFLVFPNQGHVLMDINARKTLTKEMENWWAKYLK